MESKFIVYIETQTNQVNITDINEVALIHVVEAFLRQDQSVMLRGRKIFLSDVFEFRIFKFENQNAIDGFLGACKSKNLFRRTMFGDVYLPPELFTGIAEDVSSNYLDDFTKNKVSRNIKKSEQMDKTQVFIVHGHDDLAKTEVARFIEQLGFKSIILHEQASSGKTIIEKIEEYSNVGFGVVLYTPCDEGAKKGSSELRDRARQNVVFEHGI